MARRRTSLKRLKELEVWTQKEEIENWNRCMYMLEKDPLWVIENLEKLQEFKVSWNHYGRFKKQCPNCLRYFNKDRKECPYCKISLKKQRILTFGIGKPKDL